MTDEPFNPIERMLKRKLERNETLRPDEWEDWYSFHPELKPPEIVIEDDLVPEIELAPRLEDDLQPVLDGIDILDAYARWSGKNFTPTVGSKRENIMIRCPNPLHNDAHPSAWINLDKQTWYCGACSQGDDKYGIAAYHFDHPVPGYRTNGFPELRKSMVEAVQPSAVIKRDAAGKYEIAPSAPAPIEPDPEPEPTLAPVIRLFDDEAETGKSQGKLLDWEACCTADTFLDAAMTAVVPLKIVPEEFMWVGSKLAIALACGHNVYLPDFQNIYTNALVLFYGRSGTRKTACASIIEKILREALPYKPTDTTGSDGTFILPTPGSPQALYECFSHPITNGAGTIIEYAPVRGHLYIDELSGFIAKANRPGSSFKEEIIELFGGVEHGRIYLTKTGGKKEIGPPFFCSIATTQPKAIHAFLNKTDVFSGFLNRWDVAFGDQPETDDNFSVPPDLADAIEHLKAIHVWASTKRVMRMTSGAQTKFNSFINTVLKPLRNKADSDILTRLDLKCKRDLVILAANEKTEEITEDHVEKVEIQFPYIARGCSLLTRDINFDEFDDCYHKALEKIRTFQETHGKGPTRRDLNMRLRGSGFSIQLVGRVINYLSQMDIVGEVKDGRAKRLTLHG